MFVVLSISCTRLPAPSVPCVLADAWWWLPLTFARLSRSLWVLLFVCSTVCLLPKICYRALGSYTLRRSQTAQQFIKVSCSSWSCPRQPCECVLVGVLCSVLFASVSLTLSFIICSANSWVCEGIAKDNASLMRFSYVWGLGNLTGFYIIR